MSALPKTSPFFLLILNGYGWGVSGPWHMARAPICRTVTSPGWPLLRLRNHFDGTASSITTTAMRSRRYASGRWLGERGDGGDGGRSTGQKTHRQRDESPVLFFHCRAIDCRCVCVCVRLAEGVYICRYFGSRAVDGRGPTDRLVTLRRDNECK